MAQERAEETTDIYSEGDLQLMIELEAWCDYDKDRSLRRVEADSDTGSELDYYNKEVRILLRLRLATYILITTCRLCNM